MKTIENKITEISNSAEGKEKMTYGDLLKLIANVPPANGYTIAEMRQRLKIYAELEPDAQNNINLEDADFDVVKKLVVDFKWGTLHKDIVSFVDLIESL